MSPTVEVNEEQQMFDDGSFIFGWTFPLVVLWTSDQFEFSAAKQYPNVCGHCFKLWCNG